MDSYNKIWMIIRKTDLLNQDERDKLHLYLMNLKEQVKKQKEVINKAMGTINDYLKEDYSIYTENEIEVDLIVKLKDILKEVSE